MKKFIALAIAVVMLAALAVPAFAANINDDANVEISYTVDENYTVTIPDDCAFGAAMAVTVAGNIEDAKVVSVTSANSWKMIDEAANEAAYSLKTGENFDEAVTTTALLTSDTGATVNNTVNFKTVWTDGAPTAAGTYTDTLTFAVA